MTDPEPINPDVPLSHLPSQEKAKRSGSFGVVASHYDRYRPGPPPVAVDWILPTRVGTVVDLGAGTGALTRLLTERADEVIAVEPDDRMRSVLMDEVPGIRAVRGRGESIPVPDGSADAVLASSSWHWMDAVSTLREVGRILVPGGVLGVLWSGPDPEGAFLVQARTALTGQFASLVMGDALRPTPSLEIPSEVPFDQPEHEVFRWDVALDAEELIGLLGTFSWIITMPEENRRRVIAEARRLLRELLAVEGEVTVDVTFRSAVWRSRRHP
ncbi:MAG TPA: class I SAM-dependent methyltransferase [Acidimicrobiales bacterium]|nr:class I SAM-dependent methyltransferase [Acidimicrobiales bacterium]